MPRPKSKEQLVEAMKAEHQALEKAISGLTPEQIESVSAVTGWCIKDVLAHLTEWEQMCLGWYRSGQRGETPAVPAEGYNWAQLPALNQLILARHRDDPLPGVLERFQASYAETLAAVQAIPENDLFTPGRFAWTRKNSLAAYVIGSTSSHYAWARQEVRKCLKQ